MLFQVTYTFCTTVRDTKRARFRGVPEIALLQSALPFDSGAQLAFLPKIPKLKSTEKASLLQEALFFSIEAERAQPMRRNHSCVALRKYWFV